MGAIDTFLSAIDVMDYRLRLVSFGTKIEERLEKQLNFARMKSINQGVKVKRSILAVIIGLAVSTIAPMSANAGSYCNNGSYSLNSGRGTCSYNGGVNKSYPSYSDPGSSSYKRNNGISSGLNSTGRNSLTGKSCRKGVSLC